MADALCGPSNALQNFQKHTAVDRTLQQDRLTRRHSPSQGFRSSPGPTAGALDPEFEAFQAGHVGPPQSDFHHLPPHLARPPPPPQFAQAPQGPDWASDFQRLHISPTHTPPIPQHGAPVATAASAWHQDFARQQAPAMQTPTYQQNTFGGMSGYGISGYAGSTFQRPDFGVMNGNPASEVAQGKQRALEAVPQFDEAAFEQAFAQAHQDMLEETAGQQGKLEVERGMGDDMERLRRAQQEMQARAQTEQAAEMDGPELLRIREQRPAVYAALKIRSAIDLGQSVDTSPFFTFLENMEPTGKLVEDASEAKWVVDALQRIVDRGAPQEIKTRAERLITEINERLMSTYPLLASGVPISRKNIWEELEAAGYTRSPASELLEQQPEQKRDESQLKNDDDEMAETAGRLLERVADNTSEKFQNSQFLELMRRLRDREVRVEGDKMVEVSASSLLQQASASAIPEVDPHILDHAATDFGMPVFSEEGDQESI